MRQKGGLGREPLLTLLPSVIRVSDSSSSALYRLEKWHQSFVLPDFGTPYMQAIL